jgi:hypothetical protein
MDRRRIKALITSYVIYALVLSAISCAPRRGDAQETPNDPGWPRIVETDDAEIVIYQPQIDTWLSLIHI